MSKPLQIATDFVVMSAEFQATAIPVTENLYAELGQSYGDFAGRSLISSHTFDGHHRLSGARKVFITPGEGTENREQPVRGGG